MCLLLFISVAGASYYWFSGGTFEKTRHAGVNTSISPQKVNILVLGVDERSNDAGRSDTMFVVTVDTSTKQVSLLSVPRDTRVRIPGYGWDKINHAYAEGGVKLSQRAVEDLLGIPIDYYVTINFAGFYKIVDAIGGITMDVEKRMYYQDPYDKLVIDLKPGVQKMDGRTAIQYVRYRDGDGDIGRIERQQKFMKAMLKEAASPFILPRLPAIIREVSNAVKSDLTTSEMLGLAKLVNNAAKAGLETEMVPGKPAYIKDVSYWLPDVVELRKYVASIEGMPIDSKLLADARSLAGLYEKSIPQEMKVVEAPVKLKKNPTAGNTQPDKKSDKDTGKEPDKQAVSAPNTPDKPKPTDKPSTPEQPVGKLKVSVVNASGSPDAGNKVAGTLRSRGFEVASVVGMSSTNKNTVVIANSDDSAVTGKLTGLPFRYVLQVNKEPDKANQLTVIIGKDYLGQ
ncbi:MAG TPA: LCP family protein [Methylomusa anaerophila]|nr:LCP family protein [Methylomusa anaerophila]HML89394.1 LCP family protein [Methylomusa anaerophila]